MIKEVINKIKGIVSDALKYRDSSHNYHHIIRVYKTANRIAKLEFLSPDLMNAVKVVALIHDINDKKYSDENHIESINKINLLIASLSLNAERMFYIASLTSFSTEKLLTYGEIQKLLTSSELIIRNVVSDADKLDALGECGLHRCIEYIRKVQPDVSRYVLYKKVLDHCYEKLFILPDYIRTPGAHTITTVENEKFIDSVKEFTTIEEIDDIADGLNIEAGFPYMDLIKNNPHGLWSNVIVVLDRPLLDHITIEELFTKMNDYNYPLLENTIDDLNEHNFIAVFVSCIVYYIKNGSDLIQKPHVRICIHIHQDTHASKLIEILKLFVSAICEDKYSNVDVTYMLDNPVYRSSSQFYDHDIVLSLSQCAGLTNKFKPGDIVYSTEFLNFNGTEIKVTQPLIVKNHFEEIRDKLDDFSALINQSYISANKHKHFMCTGMPQINKTRILYVTDLWNPVEKQKYKLV